MAVSCADFAMALLAELSLYEPITLEHILHSPTLISLSLIIAFLIITLFENL